MCPRPPRPWCPFLACLRRAGSVTALAVLAAATTAARAAAEPGPSVGAGAAPAASPSAAGSDAASQAAVARIEIRTSDGQGSIRLDGKEVGNGSYEGEVSPGEHRLEVVREGHAPYERKLRLGSGEVIAETVVLRLKAETPAPPEARTTLLSGPYGGVQLGALTLPGRGGSSLDTGCELLGASGCDTPAPWGPLLGGYLGWAIDPIGIELWAAGLADYSQPVAHFDGSTGSELNPLVATPARREEFLIFRAGLVTAARLRAILDFDVVRVSFAGGVGLSYRKLWARREGYAEDGTDAASDIAPDPVDYLSPGLSLELALGVPLSSVTQLLVSLSFWAESARTDARTAPDGHVWLSSPTHTTYPKPEHTPAYDLVSGPQLYLGPIVGLQFGP